MKYMRFILVAITLILASFQSTTNKTNTQKWVNLFNGKNLDNWTPKIAGYKLGEILEILFVLRTEL